ncbi:hypothetical protein ACTS9K_08065 [Empedobacter sp. ULE_I145]
MKTITTILLALFSLTISYAQTEEQTLEWLNAKKTEIYSVYSLTVSNGKLEISKDRIRAYSDDGAQSDFQWNEIKDLKEDYGDIKVVFNSTYNGKTSFIRFSIYNTELRGKYLKALKHMATLKGAKLVDDDLF